MSCYIQSIKDGPSFSFRRMAEDNDIYEQLKPYFSTKEEIFWFAVLVGFREKNTKETKGKTTDTQHKNLISPTQYMLIFSILFEEQ